jgi:hypothetical protein
MEKKGNERKGKLGKEVVWYLVKYNNWRSG